MDPNWNISKEIKDSIVNENGLIRDVLFVKEKISHSIPSSLWNLGHAIFLCNFSQYSEINEDNPETAEYLQKILLEKWLQIEAFMMDL